MRGGDGRGHAWMTKEEFAPIRALLRAKGLGVNPRKPTPAPPEWDERAEVGSRGTQEESDAPGGVQGESLKGEPT